MKHLARLLACALFSAPCLASGATIVVDPNSPLNSIQAAIDQAQPGDVVQVLPGIYYESLTLKDGVDVLAQSAGTVTVDAENDGSVVSAIDVGSSTTLQGLDFQNGSAVAGGGLYALSSSPAFIQCTFESNVAVAGGGAYLIQGSEPLFDECTFSDNVASVGGGMFLDFSKARIQDSDIAANEASDGAAIAASNAAEATFDLTSIYANRASNGGVISCSYASPTFTNCTVAANQDDTSRGTFALRGSSTRIERCIVAFNSRPFMVCEESSPWVGCSDLYGNGDDSICQGDQGTNLSLDPLFCDLQQSNFELQQGSPVQETSCGSLGAHLLITCNPASTGVEAVTWSRLKTSYR